MAVTVRIGTLVVEGMSAGQAQSLAASLRQDLSARIAAAGPPAKAPGVIDAPHAATPAALGRHIAAGLVPKGGAR